MDVDNQRVRALWMAAVAAACVAAGTACAQPVPDDDFDWITIDRPGNRGYDGPTTLNTPWMGRGSVGYTYRIARMEVSSRQWVEFVNTFSTQDYPTTTLGYRNFTLPPASAYGIGIDFSYAGPGRRYTTIATDGRDLGNLPVPGMNWRDAAMFCNWLHNGESSDPESLLHGAYDVSTWGQVQVNPQGRIRFTDALTHEPGARYWIPTLDEWLKAAAYDPDRFGPGQDGWWSHLNSSDQPAISGVPGEGTTSGGLNLLDYPPGGPWTIPLGAYSDALSPWGLLDTASGASEWLEEPFYPGDLTDRGYAGVYAIDPNYLRSSEAMGTVGSHELWESQFTSVRIASAVPAASTLTVGVICLVARGITRKRRR